jgi:hypothetical protein
MGHACRAEDDLSRPTLLDSQQQAETLAQMAQEARLIHLAFEDDSIAAPALADDLQRALGLALDAEAPDDSIAARGELKRVLELLHTFELRLSATMSELSIDGVLGAVKMPVLTARLSAA